MLKFGYRSRYVLPLTLGLILLYVLSIYLTISSQFPLTITPDAAMHAEIINIISNQGFITSWSPYAENEYTYPPLFHYLAYILPFEPIDSVRILGILIWLLFPVSIYLILSTYNKNAALIGAFMILLIPLFSNVFIYGEFPQLLAMLLIICQWYMLRTGKYNASAIITGLIILTHAFMAIIAIILFIYYFKDVIKEALSKKEAHYKCHKYYKSLIYIIIPLLIVSPWINSYLQIINNALSGSWENIRYNITQPVFGFWPVEVIFQWLFGNHGLTVFLLPLAFIGFLKTKDLWLRAFFITTLATSIFHIPLTQLKFNDLLPIPSIILASIGISIIWENVGKKKILKRDLKSVFVLFMAVILIIMGILQFNHFSNAKVNWFNPEIASTEELADAAKWLAEHDGSFVKIYAHQASAWAGILSNKIPLNPDISHIEKFSESYKKQLMLNDEIKKNLLNGTDIKNTMIKNEIKYALVPISITLPVNTSLAKLYNNTKWAVYSAYTS